MADISNEGRVQLAIDAYKKGLYPSMTTAAKAFDVPLRTFRRRVNGISARKESAGNGRKLTDTEESTLSAWILDMDQRGMPPRISTVHYLAQLLLSARLSQSQTPVPLSDKWVNRFIKRRKELCSKYTRKYDYQRAKCEDPELIKNWFKLVRNTIEKYGISEHDIYNMDETGFQMGVISTAKVVCGSETRESRAKSLQPGNREWVTAIEAVNATGWALPPQIILAAKKHQSTWYKMIPKDYKLSVSDTGWTNDELGLVWLQEMFEPYTALRTVGRYRLIILDGHSSHATAGFDKFCTEKCIIPLYMPPHSSHLLQPLDVSCFSPLKRIYGQKTAEMMQNGIHSMDKEDFLYLYPGVRQRALSAANICSGFAATGLVPLSPERVLEKLHIQLKTPTPPSTSHSNQSFSQGKTPANSYQLERQKKRIQRLRNRQSISPSTVEQAVNKAIKCAEIALQNNILLHQEISQLRTVCQRQKKKREASRYFIATGGSLTGAEGQQRAQDREEQEEMRLSQPRRKIRCSNCGKEGHNRLRCPGR
jgi:hypothetical protein